jgi:hypothetical protein
MSGPLLYLRVGKGLAMMMMMMMMTIRPEMVAARLCSANVISCT